MIISAVNNHQVLQILTIMTNIVTLRAYICLDLTIRQWNVVFKRYSTAFIVHFYHVFNHRPAGTYLLKVSDGNTRTMCEICSKLTIKTVNFEQILHIVLMFPLLTLDK